MATIADYLRQQRAEEQPDIENLLRNLSTYSRNQQLLAGLGRPDTSAPKPGLLSKTLNVLGAPGRLVQAGLLEAAGVELPGTRGMSTPEVLGAALRGDIETSASQLPGLKTQKGDTLQERLLKGAGAFAVDVATDPLSYVTAPASISRKAASQLLFRTANKADFLDNIIAQSDKGAGLIDDIFGKSVLGKAAAADTAAGLTPEVSSALKAVAERGANSIAAEELASELSETLLTRGRQGVVKRLEELTGSRSAALSIFKELPDEVRGGIVLASPTGKPLTDKTGRAIRLTSGATFGAGKVGEALNKARLTAAVYPGNVVTRYLSGRGGDVLADLKKSRLAEMYGRPGGPIRGGTRFVDYVTVRDELLKRNAFRVDFTGALNHAHAKFIDARKSVAESEQAAFDDVSRKFFFAPAQKFDADTATDVERAAFQAAGEYRNAMDRLYQEALDNGIEMGEAGARSTYSPLMLTEEGREYFEQVGIKSLRGRAYIPERGRDSYVVYNPDPEEAATLGYVDPQNPGVTYLNAQKVNDKLEQDALRAGRSAEEAKKARVFEEDPVKIMTRYGSYVTNSIANKRFIDGLLSTGTLLRSPGRVETVLAEREAATALAGISALLPEARAAAQRQLQRVDQELAQLTDVKKLDEVRSQIAAARTQLTDAANIARRRVTDLSQQVAQASAEVAEAAPRIAQVRQQLNAFADGVQRSSQELAERQRAARNVRARLATASRNVADTRTTEEIVGELFANASSGAEQAYYREVLDEVATSSRAAQARLQDETVLQQRLTSELEEIKAFRKAAREGGARDVEQMVYTYEQAVTKRNRLVQELAQARGARDEAVRAAARVERNIGLEQVANLNALVRNYVNKQVAARRAASDASLTAAEKATVNSEAAAAKKLLNQTLRVGKSEFKEVASKYADELRKAADKLTDDQFEALVALTDEENLLRYINAVRAGARDDAAVQQAMGDIWRTFVRLRDILPDEAFAKLEAAQRDLVRNSDLGRLTGATTRERGKPGELAYELAEQGYSVVNANAATKDLYASSGVLPLMRDIYKTLEQPEGWRRALNAYLDPILLAWKTSVTVGRGPGYTATNLVGGMFMNYLGNVSVADSRLAAKALFKVRDVIKQVERANPNMAYSDVLLMAEDKVRKELNRTVINGRGLGDLFSEFNRLGGFESTEVAAAAAQALQAGSAASTSAFRRGAGIRTVYEQPSQSAAEETFRRSIDFLMTNRVQRAFNDMAQTSEMFLRFSAFIDGFRRYGDELAAMDKVHLLHFNYQDLTGAEQWVRRFLPFYTWTRNNVPAQLRAMVMQPGKIQRVLYANEEFQNAFGAEGDESWLNQVLPEYLDISDGFASKFKFADNNIGFFLKLPFEDINRLFYVGESGVPGIRAREVLGSTGLLTTPIEMLSGTDLQTGAEFDPLGQEVPGYYRLLGPLANRGPEGETRINAALARGLGDILPQLGLAERLIGGVSGVTEQATGRAPLAGLSTESQREKGLATLLNFSGIPALAGLGVATVTPRSISGELRRRQGEQSTAIKKAAAELGVDVEWLREQLDEGLTPEQIFARVQAGQGKASTRAKTATRKKSTTERYQDILDSLSSP